MKIDKQEKITLTYQASAQGLAEVAEKLRELLRGSGFTAEVLSDTERTVVAGTEILLGEVCSECICSRTLPLMCYEAVVCGGKIAVSAGGAFSAMECAQSLAELFANEDELADGVILRGNAPDKNSFSEGTDARIMTTNILAKRWSYSKGLGDVPPIEQRAEVLAFVLAACAPDVVGVQETDEPWIDLFPHYLDRLKNEYGIEYKWLFTDYLDRQTLTTILYRSDKYEQVDCGIDNFSIWKTYEYDRRGYNLRLVCWVMLEEKGNKKNSFILVNTHWGNEDYAGNVAEEAELVNLLRAKYGVPVFCTGDFNARETSDEYARFMTLTGAKSTREVAAECGTLVNKTGGIGKLRMSREDGSYYIDHIFGVGNYSVLKYETVLGKACFLSDHSPHIADIKF